MNRFYMKKVPSAQAILTSSAIKNIVLSVIATGFMLSTPSWAGEGHEHGEAAPAASTAASPRVSSSSELFELVGIVERGEMVIYLDRFATNAPVLDAKIEVEIGSVKAMAKGQPDGSYHFNNAVLETSGTQAVSFTVTAGLETDLLAGDLTLGAAAHDAAAPSGKQAWLRWAAYAAALLAVLLLLAVVFKRLNRRKNLNRLATVAMALCAGFTAATSSFDAKAGEGHAHGEAAPAATGNGPRRLPDGSVFLPKISQRQLALRTVMAEVTSLPRTVELGGVVTMDPNAGGRVQPTLAGRLEAGPRGLPQLGQAVRKGEVLAFVRASANPIERGNQIAQTAELKARLSLAEKRATRLAQLEGTVAQKDQDEARGEVTSLQQRLAAVSASVSAGETLTAPVTGVIASAKAVSGQVVDAREILFEIVDPARLQVQASAFDAALPANIASASIATGSSSVALTFMGAGTVLQEGAIPLRFRTSGKEALPLAVNQPVKVVVQTKDQIKGVAMPATALVKTSSNQDMVWLHTGAEVFVPRTVRFMALDGATVSVTDGLKSGDRVVTQGAALLNQVR